MRFSIPRIGLLILLLLCLFPSPGLGQETFTESRPFRGLIRRDMAERVAQAAAEQAALVQAMRLLAKQPDLAFIHEGDALAVPTLEGLSARLYVANVTLLGARGFPPNMEAFAEVHLVPPANPREALREALRRPGSLELHSLALSRRATLIAKYDALAQELLPLNPYNGGGQERFFTLQALVRNIDAISLLLEILKQRETSWPNPEKAHAVLLKAHDMAQSDPIIRVALAETLLQLDRPAEAMEQVSPALSAAPGFARAHDLKGVIFLRQMLPALAAESFGKAIELEPKKAEYYVHRASAYLVQEEVEKMCADFQFACSFGDCEGYQWARKAGKCEPMENREAGEVQKTGETRDIGNATKDAGAPAPEDAEQPARQNGADTPTRMDEKKAAPAEKTPSGI